jgi:hypothetical protein
MMKNDIYKNCPTYETNSFKLRLVKMEDAGDLLECYSDKTAVSKMNADHCTSDFYFTTIEQMQDCISFWLAEYNKKYYVRLSILLKKSDKVIGTVEVFGGEYGVLRIDIGTAYEKNNYLEELIRLAIFDFVSDFGIDNLVIKAINTPERIPMLKKYGFVSSKTFRTEMGYYERSRTNFFDAEKGVAYCGLACCVCSENMNCIGCRNEGCKDKEWCKSFQCCKEKDLKGCWECKDYPCENPMLHKPRIRTLTKFIEEIGEERLMKVLRDNEAKGIQYHYVGELHGDYDIWEKEDEIMKFLLKS